jgi:hypothetical protein
MDVSVLPFWPRDRYIELAPRYWRITRARLDPEELELEIGWLTIPERLDRAACGGYWPRTA